jgi:diguanylate cyclase (GGDEF)-like protein
VLLDMDYFKEINDTFGHAAGDATLRALGEAITAQLRDGDVGARIGGDEFALLLHVTRPEEIDPVVARVATALSARRMPGNPEFSYGHAIWDGRESYHALAHRADVAMYRDKAVRAAAPAIALRRAR